jgi:hypothetical protein
VKVRRSIEEQSAGPDLLGDVFAHELIVQQSARQPDGFFVLATLPAIAQDDDHVIKATYTAWRLDAEIGDPIFIAAAARHLTKRGG